MADNEADRDRDPVAQADLVAPVDRFGGFMGGGGDGLGPILGSPEVAKELELSEEQIADIKKMGEEMRAQRGEDRPNFRDMSEEDRTKALEEMRKRGEEQAKVVRGKLEKILLPHQFERLEQINLQMQGVGALNNAETAAKLGLTEEQKQKISEVVRTNMESMRERMGQMRDAFQGGDRAAAMEKMTALRKESDGKVLAVLNDEQRKKYEEMKGKPFEMPRPRFGGGTRSGRPRRSR